MLSVSELIRIHCVLITITMLNGCSSLPQRSQLPAEKPLPIGLVSISGSQFLAKDIEIPASGLNLGQALNAVRTKEKGELPWTIEKPKLGKVVVQVRRRGESINLPLFFAESTIARDIMLKNGDEIVIGLWEDSPLLSSITDQNARTQSTSSSNVISTQVQLQRAIENLILTISQRRTQLSDERNQLLSEENKPPEMRDSDKIAALKINIADLESRIFRAEETLNIKQADLARLPQAEMIYTITGLHSNPGQYPTESLISIDKIGEGEALAKSKSPDVIVLNRNLNDQNEQYVLAFTQVVAGVRIPSEYKTDLDLIRKLAYVQDGDVFQFTQLRFLPIVLAGRMNRQIRLAELAENMSASQPRLRRIIPRRERDMDLKREPSGLQSSWRRFQNRFRSMGRLSSRLPSIF